MVWASVYLVELHGLNAGNTYPAWPAGKIEGLADGPGFGLPGGAPGVIERLAGGLGFGLSGVAAYLVELPAWLPT